jgi:hypothetical protein
MSTINISHLTHDRNCGGCQRAVTRALGTLPAASPYGPVGTSATIGDHVAIIARPRTTTTRSAS